MNIEWIWGLCGGLLIGLGGAVYLLGNGRIMGASGILGGLVDGEAGDTKAERLAFIAGGDFPPPARSEVDRRLIIGSVLFGMGWGLAGLCPGPAMASLTYGGLGGLVFLIAMIAGMFIAPTLGAQLDRAANAA